MTGLRWQPGRPAPGRAGLAAFAILLAGGAPAGDAAAGIELDLHGDLLTLHVRDAPVRDVLAAIAGRCHLSVASLASLDTSLTLDVERLPLAAALDRVLRGRSYLLRQGASGGANDRCNAALWVFSDAPSPGGGFTLAADTGPIHALRQQLRNGDRRARQVVLRKLRQMGSVEAIGLMSEAMADENRRIRVQAINGLADVGGPEALAAITAGLADEDTWVRSETAIALGALGDDQAVSALAHALSDAVPAVRSAAISALSEVGGPRAADALAAALGDADPELRIAAIEALGSIGGPDANRHLQRAIGHDDADVREAAGEALAGLGGSLLQQSDGGR